MKTIDQVQFYVDNLVDERDSERNPARFRNDKHGHVIVYPDHKPVAKQEPTYEDDEYESRCNRRGFNY